MSKQKQKDFHVYAPVETAKQFEVFAKLQCRSVSQQIVYLMEKELNRPLVKTCIERPLMTPKECVTVYKDDLELDLVHQPYTAFNQGFNAYKHSIAMVKNPYRTRTEQNWWEMGWIEAQQQLSDKRDRQKRKSVRHGGSR